MMEKKSFPIEIKFYSNPILVATDIIVRITDLRKRQKMNIIDELNDFINQTCIV